MYQASFFRDECEEDREMFETLQDVLDIMGQWQKEAIQEKKAGINMSNVSIRLSMTQEISRVTF